MLVRDLQQQIKVCKRNISIKLVIIGRTTKWVIIGWTVKWLIIGRTLNRVVTGRMFLFYRENSKHKKDLHRHDLNFDGPMGSPSSICSPLVKKRVWNKVTKQLHKKGAGKDGGDGDGRICRSIQAPSSTRQGHYIP